MRVLNPDLFKMRAADCSDVPAIAEVINGAYRVEAAFIEGDRTAPEMIAAMLAEPDSAFLVVDNPDPATKRLAGAVFVQVRGTRGYFGPLAVDPMLQGKGLGKAFVRAVEAYCRDRKCEQLDLDVLSFREELPPFYAALGFVMSGTAEYDEHQRLRCPAHFILMTKAL